MRRVLGPLGVLLLACTVAFAAPAGSGATPSASASAKHRCKHRHPRHRKRCRKKAPTGTTTTTTTGSTGTTSGPPGRLLATEREISPSELQLQLSHPSVSSGTTIVEQHNAGSDPHNLILERKGAVAFSFGSLDPGGDQRQTLTLKPGTWTLYCSLLDHRSLGMQATLTVD